MLTGLTSFVLGLVLSLAITLLIYIIGGRIAAQGKDEEGKFEPYACGERIQAEKVIINLEHFFIYGVYFMIFHILVFSLATTIARPMDISIPVLFAGVSLLSIAMLTLKEKK